MSRPVRIAVLGIGGVGGYVGGKLAAHADTAGTEIIFLARGESEKVIRKDGLTLVTPKETMVVHPALVTGQPEQAGIFDLVICCVKSFDLEAAITTLAKSVNHETIIIPLLNGVDATERITKVLPQTKVWMGCLYILSQLTAPGVVTKTGDVFRLLVGSDTASGEELENLRPIFETANLPIDFPRDTRVAIWEKFIFLSPVATVASYLDKSIGEILANHGHKRLLRELVHEVYEVAIAKGVAVTATVVEDTMNKLEQVPYEAVPSMLADFRKGKKTEVDALTVYVSTQGRKLNVPTPRYDQLSEALVRKSAI